MSTIRHFRALTTSSRALSARTLVQCSTRFAVARTQTSLPRSFHVIRSFSKSAAVGKSAKDSSLSQKLQEELKYETQAAAEEGTPAFLKAFQEETPWAIETSAGSDEVVLSRTFGKENIRVIFSIADIDATSEDQFLNQEGEEDEAADEEAEGSDEEHEPGPSHPIRTSITITKPDGTPGSLSIDAVCQDGVFTIDNIAYYPDSTLATELTAEADWKRRGLYMGPQFDHLDIGVQEEFETFLRNRDISEGLALFIPEYAEYKEQKEYVRWLQSVKTFIDA